MTQFKDKAKVQKKNVNVGLFTYPVLQAADILLYHGTHVPVGEDQVQHVELTRGIARAFNKRYSDYFAEPKVLLTETPRVKSLLAPEKKMSKSYGAGHVIELADEPAVIAQKVKKAVTATTGGGKAPGVENLLLLLKHFGKKKAYADFVSAEKDASIQYGELKNAVSNAVGSYFADFRERRKEFLSHHEAIADILISGAEKASVVAEKTMEEVRKLAGVR